MAIFGLKKINRRLDKYEEILKTSSLSIKQQKEIVEELRARPYRWTYDEQLMIPINFIKEFYREFKIENNHYKKTLVLELEKGEIFTFEIKSITKVITG